MRPLQLFIVAQWSIVSQPLCFLMFLNELFFHHLGWWEDKHNLRCSPHFPQNFFNNVYGQLDHRLESNPRLCFRDMDSSRGQRKHKLSGDDGNFSGIEPLLISPPKLDHPDSNRQLDLHIVPKMPGRHQGALADLPDLEVVPSLHGLQHPAGSNTSSRQVEHSGGSAHQSDQASSNRVGSQLSRFQSHHSKMGGPGIDLFTTRRNIQLLIYVSPCLDPQAFDTDPLSIDWDVKHFLYLFPPSPRLLSGSASKQQVLRRALQIELPCLREIPQDSTMPSRRNFVIGAIKSRSCLSRCALSCGVLGPFFPEISTFGY